MSQTQASTRIIFQHPILIDMSKFSKCGARRKRVNTGVPKTGVFRGVTDIPEIIAFLRNAINYDEA
jgi:hypothetical protein